MSKINRFGGNLEAFASDALSGERTLFGEATAADDLTSQVTDKFKRGWAIVGPNDAPTLQDFNALGYTSTQMLAYLHQMGVPEWHEDQEYQNGSFANHNGVLYRCKTNNHVGATSPDLDGVNWDSGLTGDAVKGMFRKGNGLNVAWTKTGANTLTTATQVVVEVAGSLKSFPAGTSVTMPSLSAGNDYSIWATAAGTLVAVLDSYSSPATAPSTNAVKVGGFHYGLVASGTTVAGGSFNTAGAVTTGGMVWTQSQVDDIAGINKYSLWDLKFRCKGEQRGMAYDPWVNAWAGIYFVSSNHITNGPSRFNSDVASGTVLPRIPLAYGGNGSTNYTNGNWWTFNEIAASFGLRLPREREFVSAAFGVTENQSLGGASSTIPATNRQAGYTSRIGLEQATGHHWTWGEDSSTRWDGTGGFAWRNLNGGRGQIFIGGDVNLVRVILGGSRFDAAVAGSRASIWRDFPWFSLWNIGGRLFGDHVCLL